MSKSPIFTSLLSLLPFSLTPVILSIPASIMGLMLAPHSAHADVILPGRF